MYPRNYGLKLFKMGCIVLDEIQATETLLWAFKSLQNKFKETPFRNVARKHTNNNFFRNSIRNHLNESTRINYVGSPLACLCFLHCCGVVIAKLLEKKTYQEAAQCLICSNCSFQFTCFL